MIDQIILNVVISTELISIIVSLILLYGNLFETHQKSRCSTCFTWIMIVNIMALLSDAASWIFEGDLRYMFLLYLSNTLSIVLAFVLMAIFSVYITSYIGLRATISRRFLRMILLFYSVCIIATSIACISGAMFTLDNAVYESKSFYNVYSVAIFSALIITLALVFKYRKELGKHDSIAACCYIVIPTISALLNIIAEDMSFTYLLTTIASLLLYVMIQSEHNSKLYEEKQITSYYAMHDELTGLLSRRAYIDKLDYLSKSDIFAGVVFCDINGLKYVNDNFGHTEGDNLIKNFSDTLSRVFKDDFVYRISGDEFIAVVENKSSEVFNEYLSELENAVVVDGICLASFGADYGKSNCISHLIHVAETKMYNQKSEFYKEHPELLRTKHEM